MRSPRAQTAIGAGDFGAAFRAGWHNPTVAVPLLLVAHLMAFVLLLRRGIRPPAEA